VCSTSSSSSTSSEQKDIVNRKIGVTDYAKFEQIAKEIEREDVLSKKDILNAINPNDIKISSRSFTRISGLPKHINLNDFLNECNIILKDYREKTKDVLMTSFKGLRKDGKYRRRLDFKTVRYIMNKALKKLNNESQH
jgi:hypothetical protein